MDAPSDQFLNFSEILRKACEFVEPEDILEWGPGNSTALMRDACPSANILTIEHDKKFYKEISKHFNDDDKIEVFHRIISKGGGESTGYVNFPLYRQIEQCDKAEPCFDLVFIDGRLRFDCLITAWILVKQQGMVILHDADRQNYRPAVKIYKYRTFFNNEQVAVLSHSSLDEFKTIMKAEN